MEGVVGALDVAHLSALPPEGDLALISNGRAGRCAVGLRCQDRTGGQMTKNQMTKTYPKGRVCEGYGSKRCSVIQSVFNKYTQCSLCQDAVHKSPLQKGF